MSSLSSHHSEAGVKKTGPLTIDVKSIVAHLTLRQEPRVSSDTVVRFVTPDEILRVIETENPLAKIGVKGQWLHVRTAGGTEGFVAAWFVQRI